MKATLFLISVIISAHFLTAQVTAGVDWSVTNITTDLAYPFEITYGPDSWLWITERRFDERSGFSSNIGERVIRVNPVDGTKIEMLDLSTQVYYGTGGQDGLLGMAIHPDLYTDITTTTNNYVFVAYSYDSGGGISKFRIARLLYNNTTKLLSPDASLDTNGAIIQGLPASNDHQAGRLKIGPDLKLYYTIGDQGANQFAYYCNPDLAQVLPTSISDYTNYAGKVLRLNLDGTIPVDNPTLGGIQSHVYSYGHRNPQGLVFAADGTLYSSEQMDKVDDELNKIVAGGNYGWPEIAGYFDNMGYVYCNWSSSPTCGSVAFTTAAGGPYPSDLPSGPNTEFQSYPSGAPVDFKPPIGTIGTSSNTEPTGSYLSWPTVAPSSLDIYEAGKIPEWGKSLFITSLKKATLFRAKLTAGGDDIEGDVYEVFHKRDGATAANDDRYRDTAFNPDGVTMYVITDTNSVTNKGAIIKIEYTGVTLGIEDDILNAFQLYPNPSTNHRLNLTMPNDIYEFNITVSNVLGQVVYAEKVKNLYDNTHIVNAENYKSGIYFVTVQTDLGKATKKLIIQ